MAGRKYWLGGSGDDDATGGDWNTAANWSPASIPVLNDVLVFGGQANIVTDTYSGSLHTIGKHWNCEKNMNHAGLDLGGIIVTAEYTGLIGLDAGDNIDRLLISIADGGEIRFCGNESAYIKCDGTKNIPLLIFNSETGNLVIDSDAASDLWNEILCTGGGTLEIETGALVDKIVCSADFSGTLDIGTGVTDGVNPLDLEVYAGTIYSNSAWGATIINGAAVILGKTTLPVATALDVTSLLMSLGTLTWRAAGVLKAATINGGIVNVIGDGNKVLGVADSVIIELLGGKLDASVQRGNFELATGTKLLVRGNGIFVPAPNNNYTWTKQLPY